MTKHVGDKVECAPEENSLTKMTTAIHRTPEEAKNHYIGAMGKDLGQIFYALWHEVGWLHNE